MTAPARIALAQSLNPLILSLSKDSIPTGKLVRPAHRDPVGPYFAIALASPATFSTHNPETWHNRAILDTMLRR